MARAGASSSSSSLANNNASSSSSSAAPKPPPSATPLQLKLWHRVLTRRKSQLMNLDADRLRAIRDLLVTDDDAASTAQPQQQDDQTKEQHVSYLERLLALHFYRSVDDTLNSTERYASLDTVKNLFTALDAQIDSDVGRRLRDAAAASSGGSGGEGSGARTTGGSSRGSSAAEGGGGSSSGGGGTGTNKKAGGGEGGGDGGGASSERSASAADGSESAAADGAAVTTEKAAMSKAPSSAAGTAASASASTSESGPGGGGGVVIDLIDDDDEDGDDESDSAAAAAAAAPPTTKTEHTPASSSATTAAAAKTKKPAADTSAKTKKKAPPKKPRTSSKLIQISFKADVAAPTLTHSASLQPRSACTVTVDMGYDDLKRASALDGSTVASLQERFDEWDPYWTVLRDWTSVANDGVNGSASENDIFGYRTAPILSTSRLSYGVAPVSATTVVLSNESLRSHPKSTGVSWGTTKDTKEKYRHDEKRLVMRTLPLHRDPKYVKKRADTHLWPKGTFVQINGEPTSIVQRKQQSHDASLWKGMAHSLDLTGCVQPGGGGKKETTTVNVCTREGTMDKGGYGVQIAVCQYVSPDALYDRLMSPTTEEEDEENGYGSTKATKIQRLTYDESIALARNHLTGQTVVLEQSDDEGEVHRGHDDVSLTFSLLCPLSRTVLETPVRGINCKHLQCFDLRNYLRSNETVSGGRWRCGVCEDFVSVKNLVRCGLFVAMLDKHGKDVSGSRDKVRFHPDGSWSLMDANRLRYNNNNKNKRSMDDAFSNGGGGEDGTDAKRRKGEEGGEGGGGPFAAGVPPDEEIIDIL